MLITESDEAKRIRAEYGHVQYPEDVKEKLSMRQFPDEFKHLSPTLHPESADDWEEEALTVFDEPIPVRDRAYNKPIPGFSFEPEEIKLESKKFDTEF
jgi:hypothetical protein